jgi:class 3 adenylate cyclase
MFSLPAHFFGLQFFIGSLFWILIVFHPFSLQGETHKFQGKAYIEEIAKFQPPKGTCNPSSALVSVPYPLNRMKDWKEKISINYCIPIEISSKLLHQSLGLSLGYIDNFYRIYWNGEEVGSTLERENLEIIFYDEPVILKIPKNLIRTQNILEVQVKKSTNSISGGGIFGGILEISPYTEMLQRSRSYVYYNFAKVILFLSSSILFFILFLGRKKDKEFFYFGLFLFIITIYYFTKLELKYELNLPILLLKKIEYLSFTLILPVFAQFLFKFLKISRKNLILYSITIIGPCFHIWFWLTEDIHKIENYNYLYHIPFMLFSLFGFFSILIFEIYKKNKRAIPIFFVMVIPLALSLLQISNIRFGYFPFLSGILLGGDAIIVLIISMAAYVGGQFYSLQKKLDYTIQKEESLRKTFQLYVPPKDIERILSSFNEDMEPTNLGTLEEKTILFCDIREFTNLSEKMSPTEVVKFLNIYFERFNRVIWENGGIIDKLIGDCIMARFEAGKEMYAILTALQIKSELEAYNKVRKRLRQKPIANGVGLSIGSVVLGNIGSRNKMDFTVIGDAVNVASRLESLTKFYNVPILITESLYKRTQEYVTYREIDKILIKGKKKSTKIYEPLGIDSTEWLED